MLHSAPGAGTPSAPDLHFGPGHCSVIALPGNASSWAFVYAAEQPNPLNGMRNVMLDAISWTADGWPIAAHGEVPSNTQEPVPT